MSISIKELTKWYGTQLVLHELSYELTEPALIALVAPNGSGKTTLLNIMCGLEQPSSGDVKIFGETPSWQQFKHVSYMQDNTVLFRHLSGMDHLEFVAENHGLMREEIIEVTDSLRMTDYLTKKVKNYSLGMKQHLLFAMAILPKPRLLLLDEPLNGLDPASIVRVRELMLELHQEGTTIIFSSHNLDQIDKLTDKILFLKDGTLVTRLPTVVEYQLVVSERSAIENYLTAQELSYTILGEYKLSCDIEEADFSELEEYCQAQGIIIFDQHMLRTETETLYFDLFGEEEDEASV